MGSSFIRAILPFKPSKLYVVDISENELTELTRDLRSTEGLYVPENYKTYPISYANRIFEKILELKKVLIIVANFSAHKHACAQLRKINILLSS